MVRHCAPHGFAREKLGLRRGFAMRGTRARVCHARRVRPCAWRGFAMVRRGNCAPVRLRAGMPCAGHCGGFSWRGGAWHGCGRRVRLAGFAALWRVARVRVAHGIAGGIVRRLAGSQRMAGHCGAARGGFIVAAAGAWKTRKPLIYNGFSAFQGAWRGAVFP